MTRIRVGLIITMILSAGYAAASLLDNLRDFGIGIAVCSLAVVVYGLVDFIEARDTDRMMRGREAVWARREQGSWRNR